MRRAGNLYEKICTRENLQLAFLKAARGKSNRREVMVFRRNLNENLKLLQTGLLDLSPDLGRYRFFKVFDPKERLICAAPFSERVLHHAVMNICEPRLDAYAIYDSYACRLGKGGFKALARAREFAGKNRCYLKLDIRKYFDSIDHQILMSLLERRFKDKKLLQLFHKILQTYHIEPGKGLPIGNLISQHLANFYLGHFDHWLKEKRQIKPYLRYMDDFLVFTDRISELKTELHLIENFLGSELGLKLKNTVQLNYCRKGISFLGFRVFFDRMLLSPQSRKRFIAKFRFYEKEWQNHRWDEKTLQRHVAALVGSTELAHAFGFRKSVIARFGISF